MSSDRGANCYELQDAGAISARLSHRAADSDATPTESYVRFVPSKLYGVESPVEVATEIGQAIPESEEVLGSPGWERLLEWCTASLDAHAAFLVDARGLIVGSRGRIPQEEIEEIGARLLIAFDQADHMSPGGSRILAIQRAGDWLVGLRVPFVEDEDLTIGMVTQDRLSGKACETVREAFARKSAVG